MGAAATRRGDRGSESRGGVGRGSTHGGAEQRGGSGGDTAATGSGEVTAHGEEEEEQVGDDGGGYDYRSVTSEIFKDGDLDAGETMESMYDFVDDIVETQHVPTIQDPFDHRGRFHR